jgi:hypothetical protein
MPTVQINKAMLTFKSQMKNVTLKWNGRIKSGKNHLAHKKPLPHNPTVFIFNPASEGDNKAVK